MKPALVSLLGSLALLTMTGCGGMQFAHYGGQQKAWPTGSSFSDQVYEVPVFRGWPERSYEVMGSIAFENANIDWNQGDVKQAARKAKAVGGDALLMLPKGDVTSPTLAALRTDLGISSSRTTAVVLKWK